MGGGGFWLFPNPLGDFTVLLRLDALRRGRKGNKDGQMNDRVRQRGENGPYIQGGPKKVGHHSLHITSSNTGRFSKCRFSKFFQSPGSLQ